MKTDLMTANVVAPGAVAADLLPAEQGDCDGVSTAPPPTTPISDPTPPPPGPAPAPAAPLGPAPPAVLPADLDLRTLSGTQLDALDDSFAGIVDDCAVAGSLEESSCRVTQEIFRRLIYGGVVCDLPECDAPKILEAEYDGGSARAAIRAATPKRKGTVLLASVGGGKGAKTSTATFSTLGAGLTKARRAQSTLTTATARVRTLTRTHKPAATVKRAKRTLKRARTAVAALHLQTVRLTPTTAGRSKLAVLRRRLAKGKAVRVYVFALLKDPLTGRTSITSKAERIRPPRR